MKTLIKKLKGLFSKKPNVWYKDSFYHTGYYRFSGYFHGSTVEQPWDSGVFKVGGIPCLPQEGMKDFIFFSSTDLCGMRGVIPVEKCYNEKSKTNEK